ncbi:MAG: alginate export family protein [Candidatus Omnitrophica bacterium]|nr:alginate export family protein [Candidatus Omnitrophota bacterium]
MVRFIVVGLLAFAVALTGTAYAEVQNIKVSGDIDLKGISQHNYDLQSSLENQSFNGGIDNANTNDDSVGFFLSTTRVRVDADLTDNVSASVRLLNQRVWDAHSTAETIHLDNAYVVLKEFLYSPLTVIAGRQNLQYGDGFIIGDGLLADPEGVFAALDSGAAGVGVHTAGIGQEHSAYNAYDAIRMILDFAPLTVEGVIAKMNEAGAVRDDSDLYGVIVNYKLDQWNAEIEPYWFWKNNEADTVTTNDSLTSAGALRTYEHNDVHTVGLRLAGSPIENLRLSGEGAGQWGELTDLTAAAGIQERDRQGWAGQLRAEYDWVTVPWTPTTGIGWVFYSGEEGSGEGSRDGLTGIPAADERDEFEAWDPVFRGQFHTFIQDFFDGQDAPASLYTTGDVNDTAATTNRHLIFGDVGIKPMEDLTVWARYTHARFAEGPRSGRDEHAGDELDVKVVYDYTEDVQLGTWAGWFFPGDYYDEPVQDGSRSNDIAWVTGGSASVKF